MPIEHLIEKTKVILTIMCKPHAYSHIINKTSTKVKKVRIKHYEVYPLIACMDGPPIICER